MKANPLRSGLQVTIEGNSAFLGKTLTVEIRDSDLNLIQQGNPGSFPVPEGIYEVSAVLEDGKQHRKLVQVRTGKTTNVILTPLRPAATAPPFLEQIYKWDDLTGSLLGPRFVSATEAVEVTQIGLEWQFSTLTTSHSIPRVTFQIGTTKQVKISLPISADSYPANRCVVKAEQTAEGIQLAAWIDRERTVASALQHMLLSGFVFKAAALAEKAIELLRSKYEDPTGAALGALILCKVGRLDPFTDWVENLAMDFDWLPEGKVLLALLRRRAERHAEAVSLALAASEQTMLYAETFSLLLGLLRQMSRDLESQKNPQHSPIWQATQRLAERAASIDWTSSCLSETTVDEDTPNLLGAQSAVML